MTEQESLLAAIDEEVELHSYDPAWPVAFAAERDRLLSLFPGKFTRIEHIGSTAVPGLRAKPVIDLLAGVESMAVAESLADPLCGSGYTTSAEFNATLSDRKWFMRWANGHRTHHLHVMVFGSAGWHERIRFREALRSNPEVAAKYAALKESLAAAHTGDREAYTDAKSDFVRAAVRARYDLVIFDCDGVLVDSEPIANRVLVDQLDSIGLRMPADEVMRRFVGRTRDGCLKLAKELLGRDLPGDFATKWDATLFDALDKEVKAIDGVVEVIERLGLPYCVASNGMPDRMRLTLRASGLLPLFEGRMFTAAEVARPKPAPDLFLHAAKSMGAAPSRCAVIEDTPTGARAGIAAGMTVFGYAGGAHSDRAALEAEGAKVFDRMHAVAGLIGGEICL